MTESSLGVIAVIVTTTMLVVMFFVLFRISRISGQDALTKGTIALLLRGETDLVRKSNEEQARGLRSELGMHLKGFQDTTIKSFGVLSEGANNQIRAFGERLDAGIKIVDQRVDGIASKLNADLAQMADDATKNRDALRKLIEDKLEAAAAKQSDEAKALREELDGSFHRLGGNVSTTLTQVGQDQKERLEATAQVLKAFSETSEKSHNNLRHAVEGKLDVAVANQSEEAKRLREELNASFHLLGVNVGGTLTEIGQQQKERLDTTARVLESFGEKYEKSQEALKQTVENRLDAIRQESATKLEEMRQTVDHKLQTTLETRLGESFNRVVEQLNRVHEGLGEMKTLASNVGDLKNVLTNVKVRGTFGEVQLELLLEQFLTPDQYIKDAHLRDGSSERVEFAIRLPGKGAGEEVLLPIDAKFPRESYDRLLEASEIGDSDAIEMYRKQLETQVRLSAKSICDKYINAPRTTDFAILFLPTEGLYAQVLRQPGVFESIQRDYRVTLAGPTTLSAILNALQMGFRSIAIEKRSSEVWQILGAVKNEFGKYNEVVDGLSRQLRTALSSVDKLGTRARVMTKTLKEVEVLSGEGSDPKLLSFDGEDIDTAGIAVSPSRSELQSDIVIPEQNNAK
jgi:DNA recombination protein RmuC